MDEKNYNQIIKAIDKDKVVSFDIFDTLLLRPFVQPKDVFKYMESVMGVEDFYNKRVTAENKARKNKKYEDVTFEEIYHFLPEFDRTKELEKEHNFLFANDDIRDVYDYALNNAKCVIITSDMYLPKDFLEQVLQKNNYTNYTQLYVSSEVKKTKETGNLYKEILSELNIMPKDLIHIGDNIVSDFAVPRKLGINAFHYPKVSDLFLKDCGFRSKIVDNWINSLFVQLCAVNNKMRKQNYWEKFGYEIAGPLCFSYVSWICDEIQKVQNTVSDVAFVARDGYLLEKIFTRISNFNKQHIHTHYLFAPRMINIICELSTDIGVSYFEKKHYHALLKYYKHILPKVEVDISIEELREIVLSNETVLKGAAEKEFSEYKKYISEEEYGDGKIFIVDSRTENYSAQNLIEKTLGKKVTGLYWVIGAENDKYSSSAYQKERQNVLLSWQLIEFILSAPTPPIETIKGGKPIYNNSNSYENTRVSIFRDIEKGVERFVDDICTFNMDSFVVPEPLIRQWLNDFCCNGDKTDVEEFSTVMFSNNPDHSDLMVLMPFTKKARNFNEYKENLFRMLTLHPRLYGMVRKLYHMINKIRG